jgi:hypothetical protein
MADAKISALPASTTPLAGTEVVPLVQSGATKQVSVANLTAGRAVSALSYNATSFSRVTAEGAAIGSTGQALQVQRTTDDSILYAGYRTTPNSWVIGATYSSTGAYRPIIFATSDLARVTVATGGDVTVNTGNLVIGTSGKGIDFSATPGTGTSELLADYEEGDWTPVVTAGVGTITSYTSSGKYTKTGRQVTATFIISSTDNGTGASYLIVTGQPFTQLTNVALYGYNQSTGISIGGQMSSGTMNLYTSSALYPVATGQTINCTITYFV